MYKVIAAVIVAAFAFGSTATFAQNAGKSEELTMEQRAEMRERAARLKTQGPQAPVQDKVEKKAEKAKSSAVRHTHKAKHATVHKMHKAKHKVAHKAHKGKKIVKRNAKKARSQA
ncbi:MAG TPA: hypothetical protein VM164_15040 [Burkholderiales bacterium]|nr:hypothetical protein [Burkholderiales bacterium]